MAECNVSRVTQATYMMLRMMCSVDLSILD
jgi:hypothetical protein